MPSINILIQSLNTGSSLIPVKDLFIILNKYHLFIILNKYPLANDPTNKNPIISKQINNRKFILTKYKTVYCEKLINTMIPKNKNLIQLEKGITQRINYYPLDTISHRSYSHF